MLPTNEQMYNALEQRHGVQLQKKFSEASVAVCGLGGLGSNIAIALARAGVGRLHLIDFDRVDISNLNRQQYFADQIGIYKTEALAENLKRIAPYCEVKTDTIKLDEGNIPEILGGEQIICEAFDNAEQKAMLVNCVLSELSDKYLVAASGMAGIGSANDIVTRRVSKRFYICGDGCSDISDGMGLFASRAMLCAAHQAHAVLRIIAGEYDC